MEDAKLANEEVCPSFLRHQTKRPSAAFSWLCAAWLMAIVALIPVAGGDVDLVIPPALQLKMAARAKSHISHTHGSHPSMIEHPEATVAAIMAAMSATQTR